MDKIENDLVKEFLSQYPSEDRKQCLEAVVNFGIYTIAKKYPFGLTTEQLYTVGKIQRPTDLSKRPYKLKHQKKRATKQKVSFDETRMNSRQKEKTNSNTSLRKLMIPHRKIESQHSYHIKPLPENSPMDFSSLHSSKQSSRIIKTIDHFLSNPFINVLRQKNNSVLR